MSVDMSAGSKGSLVVAEKDLLDEYVVGEQIELVLRLTL